MKIKELNREHTTFGDIEPGEVFRQAGVLYMRILTGRKGAERDFDSNAVRLGNGALYHMLDNAVVEAVNGQFVEEK